MTDVTKVRMPCVDHGFWFRHMIDPNKPGKPKWCEGGETVTMRRWKFQSKAVGWQEIESEDGDE